MDSAYIHILGTTYKAGLPLALFSEILKDCDSFLQIKDIKYGKVFGGVQRKICFGISVFRRDIHC